MLRANWLPTADNTQAKKGTHTVRANCKEMPRFDKGGPTWKSLQSKGLT
jgi:hypothetical protein